MAKTLSKGGSFTSRWGMIMVLIGMSMGPAAFWRFPRMVGAYGGGTFIICMMIGALVWAVPLLIAEGALGKGTRFSAAGAIRTVLGKKKTWIAGWMIILVLMLTSYFNVIGAWILKYASLAITGNFKPGLDGTALFNDFTSDHIQVVFWHALTIAIVAFVLYRGVVGGVEKATKFMVPALLLFTLICVVWAITRPGGLEGLNYMFAVQPEYFANGETWLMAFMQIAWAVGAGWGLVMAYAIRYKNDISPGTNAFTSVFGGCIAATIAAMAIIPTVFATVSDDAARQEIFQSGNQGLTFMVMPELFANMPFGSIIGTFFFIALIFAFLGCQFGCVNFMISIFEDMGWKRNRACILSAVLIFLVGLPSAINISFLNNQDWVWGVGLMLTAVFISGAVLKAGAEKLRTEVINTVKKNNIIIGKWWNYLIRLIPFLFVILVGWNIYQAIVTNPNSWYDPFGELTVGTIIFQWAIALIVAFILRPLLNKYTKNTPPIIEEEPSLKIYLKAQDSETQSVFITRNVEEG